MTIKEIECRSGQPRANVRYYEAQGLLSPTRSANGYRDYSEDDLTTLLKIKLLRELDCSLEDILALQRGAVALPQLLERQLDALNAQGAALDRAKALCAQLREEGVSYAQLEPRRYLDEAPTSWAPDGDEPPRHPWRRFFARSLDTLLYTTLFRLFLALALGQSGLNRPAGDALAVTLVGAALALVCEPILLRFFGATPGKWAFRLRLTGDDGKNLSYPAALERTAKVLLFGDCLGLPLAGLIANFLAYRRDKLGRRQPWEREDELYRDAAPEGSRPNLRAALLYGAFFALAVGLLTGAEWKVARLPYPRPRTVAQFSANYNHILRYQSAGSVPAGQLLTDQGAFSEADDQDYLVYAPDTPPQLRYETDGAGRLTAVTLDWDQTFADLWFYPSGYLVRTLQALEGKSALFPSDSDPLYLRCRALAAGDADALSALPAGAWQAQLTQTFSGCHLESEAGIVVINAHSQDDHQRAAVRLRLTAEESEE